MFSRVGSLAIATCACLWAEVPGLPSPPRPGAMPAVVVAMGNDLFGFGRNPDDYRTSSVGAAAVVYDDWLVGFDFSFFTRRGSERWRDEPAGEEGRTDMMTFSVGRRLGVGRQIEDGLALDDVFLAAGLGLRLTGDLGGNDLQNSLHLAVDDMIVDLPYESTSRAELTGWFSGSITKAWPSDSVWLIDSYGYWFRAQAQATNFGQFDSSLGLAAVAHRNGFTAWFGLHHDLRLGYDVDATIDQSMDVEEGFAVGLGLAVGPMSLEMGRQLEADRGWGRISVYQALEYEPREEEVSNAVTLEVGTIADEFPLVATLLWSPKEVGDLFGDRQRTSLGVFYANGGLPSDDFDRSYQEVAMGFDVEIPIIERYSWIHGRVAFGAGWRFDSIEDSDGHRYHTNGPTAIGRIGLGLDLAQSSGTQTTLGLVTGYIASWPFDDETVMVDGDPVRLMISGQGLMFGLSAMTSY